MIAAQKRPQGTETDYVYSIFILFIGLSFAGTLVYGMAVFEKGQSISEHMITFPSFRALLSIQVTFQVSIWMICAYSKKEIAPGIVACIFTSLLMIIVGWSGLSTFLTGTIHYLYAGLAIANVGITALLFSRITWQSFPRTVILVGFFPYILCVLALVALLGTPAFYIPEYLAFIFYSLFFTAFFVAHPYYDWARMPEIENAYKAIP
jgi:hypothetical protein